MTKHIGVIYTGDAGDAGDMSPPLFEMADFVPTTFWKWESHESLTKPVCGEESLYSDIPPHTAIRPNAFICVIATLEKGPPTWKPG